MLIDPICPVEARSYEIQYDKSKDLTYCKVVFCNLSDKVVTNLKYYIVCFDSFGEPIGDPPNNEVMEHIEDINAEPRYFFSGKAPTPLPNHNKTRSVQIIITKVKFHDGSIWVYESSNLIDIKTVKLEKNELSNLKEVAGEDAICYAREDKNYWQCVCGRVNALESSICIRCDRNKEETINEASNQETVNYEIEHNEKKRKELYERENEQNLSNGFKAAKEYLARAKADYQFRMRIQKCINEDEHLQLAKKEGYIFTIDELNEAKEWLKKFEDYL